MFVMTAKLSKPKLLAAGVILVAVIAAIVMLLKGGSPSATAELHKGSTDAERAAYLATYGWSINAQPKETQTVTVPNATDNKIFARYNDLQISQGFDLTPYAGQEVTRYVYEILNYPDATAPVYAGLLVKEGLIIGGEITDTSPNGVMHGFQKPGTTQSGSESQAPTESTTVQPTDPTEAQPTNPSETTATEPTTTANN